MMNKALIFLLLGILLLSIPIFRQEWFWNSGEIGAWLFNLCITAGVLACGYAVGKFIRIRPLYVWGTLILLEVFTVLVIGAIVVIQPATVPFLRFFQNVYALLNTSFQYEPNISEYHPALGYLFRKNITSPFSQWEFSTQKVSTNFLGLRDDSLSGIHPEIILLGDSFTAGWGVEQDEMFGNLLEKKLNRKVLNAGISSFGTVRESLLLKQLPGDSCRLVIIQYCANDSEENKAWSDSIAAFRPSLNAQKYAANQVRNSARKIYVPFKFLFFSSLKMMQYLFLAPEKHDNLSVNKPNSTLEHTVYFLKALRYLKSYYKGNVLIVSLSNSVRFDTQFIQEAKQRAEKEAWKNLYFLNVSSSFKRADNYLIDGHNTPVGHRKIAGQLSDFIKKNGL